MKKIFKKLSIIIMTLTLITCSILFVSCGKKNSGGNSEGDNNGSQTETPAPEPVTVEVSTYHELKTAVKGDADIVKLLNDIDIRSDSMNQKDFFLFERKLTLDLNGKKIYSTNNIYDEISNNKAMLEISEGANVTITGGGQVVANNGDAYAIQVTNGGKLKIESGEFVGNRQCISVVYGTVEIRGGKFSIQEKKSPQMYDPGTELSGYGYLIDCMDANIAYCSIVVKGGEFINFNPQNNIANGINTNYLVTGYKSTLLPESTETVKIFRVTINN